MQDFLERLDGELNHLVTCDADPARAAAALGRARRRRAGRRRPAFLGGLAALTGVAGALVITGTSTAELPILQTETTDATGIEPLAHQARRAGADFSAAHHFDTPAGPGYVMVNDVDHVMCLVMPDADEAGANASACQPIAQVERRGLTLEAVGDRTFDPDATSLVVHVLPEGAEEPRVSSAGRATAVEAPDGIVILALAAAGTLSWSVDGRRQSRSFDGPFSPITELSFDCPDGSRVSIPPTPRHKDAPRDLRADRRKACAR